MDVLDDTERQNKKTSICSGTKIKRKKNMSNINSTNIDTGLCQSSNWKNTI